MNEPLVSLVVELRDVVARAMFNSQYRLRDFDNAKPYLKKVSYLKADEAIRRAGVDNIEIQVKNTLGKVQGRKER